MKVFFIDRSATPLGELLLVIDEKGHICALDWVESEARLMKRLAIQHGRESFSVQKKSNPNGLMEIMLRYFSGELTAIDSLPILMVGTQFQLCVWQQLRKIPCGEIITYGELAKRIGRPTASRAVGMANRSNPISIAVPCHRVIGSNGNLTGYAGGIVRKQWLLQHEGFLPKQE